MNPATTPDLNSVHGNGVLAPARNVNAGAKDDPERKHELGQYFTPAPIADFMSGLFERLPRKIRLLDAGAGAGALTAAFVRRACAEQMRPESIAVTTYELDANVLGELQATLHSCQAACAAAGIELSSEVVEGDFIEAALRLARSDLFSRPATPFNAAILNPPYRKINSNSRTRRLLREADIETSNIYTGFLALAAKLLDDGGEMVAITPRSFCSGSYFRPFRELFLGCMSLRRLHLFESRSAAFREDAVLQENIILHAVKSPTKPNKVVISSSTGERGGLISEYRCDYAEVVSPRDPERFIHLVADESQQAVRGQMSRLATSLTELGLEVSTGRVVDFRARDFLVREPEHGTAPLIYPCHFDHGFVLWPRLEGRKPNAIRRTDRTEELLVHSAVYVLVKRFTSKEEARRVVACIYDPERIAAESVGFENHVNYFHAQGRGLQMSLAKGLAVFLSSTVVDAYFRQFNGHTQVNATDLRSLRYPTRTQLESLGRPIGREFPDQAGVDALVKSQLF